MADTGQRETVIGLKKISDSALVKQFKVTAAKTKKRSFAAGLLLASAIFLGL